LLVYAIVKAPEVGWGAARTIGELAGACALLAAFALNELRSRNPLFPFSILRIPGLAAADATQMIAIAGFYSMFFFITLYMQNVLDYSPIKAGSSWLPTTFGVAVGAGVCTQLLTRTGTRPIIAAGALVGAGGVFWLSRVPVHGTYLADLLPPMVIMSLGLGAVFVGVQTAANAGVPPDKAGLAAALVNTSQQLGAALGLAIFSAIATSRTDHLLRAHATRPVALTSGFRDALVAASVFLLAAALIALRATNTRGAESAGSPEPIPEPALP
jgi:predicted MFS family arabinose efflux permease